MYRWQGLHDVPATWGRSVVTIGVFDGVHRGHQRIVARAAEKGAELGLPLVVITFDPHPDEVVRPGSHPPLLCTPRYRTELLSSLGADAVCVLPFSYEFSQLPAEDFVRSVLVDGVHAAAVVVGENFRFGHKAAGNVALLERAGGEVRLRRRGRSAAVRPRRHRLLELDQGPALRRGSRRRRGRPRPAAPGRGRCRPRPPARPGARVSHRQRRAATAHGHPGGRRLRGLAGQPGHRRRRGGTLAGRDLGRHQPDLRRSAPDRRGIRARPG